MAQLNTAAGDGGLRVSVGSTGSFSGGYYDPIGAGRESSTTYESNVAFRIGNSGRRQYLSDIATNVVQQASTNPNSTASSFTASGLQFNLQQTVRDLTKNGRRAGSGLLQSYQITNTTNAPISFELVRYFDGDLQFDGTLADRGGRILRNGRDILFETDSGDNAAAPTTFVGILANGGAPLTNNRFEIGEFSSLRSRILAGNDLANTIQGDTNGDAFIDSAPYDVTPAFRNTFVLNPGATTLYSTETLFGSGIPNQFASSNLITVAATANAFEDSGTPGTFTFTRAESDLTKELTVFYTLSGKASSGVDYENLSGSVTFATGSDKATVNINPIADNLPEGIESVILTIDEREEYNLSDRSKQARVAISDNASLVDILPKASISGSPTIVEGNSGVKTAIFNVTLDKPSEVEVTVDVSTADGTATAGSDYIALEKATLYFAPGETRQQIAVDIIGDRELEPDETFSINIVDATNIDIGSNRSITETIEDKDTPITLSVTDANAAETKTGEAKNPAQFTITRTGDLSKPFTVQYRLSGSSINGRDYNNISDTAIFAAGVDRVVIDINPIDDSIFEGSETLVLSVSPDDYILTGDSSLTATIADNNDPSIPLLSESANKLLSITGGTEKTLLKFTKSSQPGNDRSEIALFIVDDSLGSINGIKPGESGYLAAAIARAQTIFSSLGNSDFDKQWDSNSQRFLDVTQDNLFGFIKIDNDTLDLVKNDLLAGKQPNNVSISIPTANGTSPIAIATNNNGYTIGFNNLVLNVQPIDNLELPKGAASSTKSLGEVLDLRGISNASVDLRVIGDCRYDNYVAFYQVEDEQGTLANGLKPGDAGYAKAAIENAVFRSRFKSQLDSGLAMPGGKILAPVVIANGSINDFLKQNPTNAANSNIHAYFNYIGANTDKIDHFRLLGDNKFGVEDSYGGGDRDFNDMIIQLKVN